MTERKYVLLSWATNNPNETNCFGMDTMPLEEWDILKLKIKSAKGLINFEIEESHSVAIEDGETLLQAIDVKEISEKDFNVFQKLIQGHFGYWNWIRCFDEISL